MTTPKQMYYEKRAQILVKNLQSRHFDAYYCDNREEALKKALELIPEESVVGWGGALSAEQIGLMDAIHAGNYEAIDRAMAKSPEEREEIVATAVELTVNLPKAIRFFYNVMRLCRTIFCS